MSYPDFTIPAEGAGKPLRTIRANQLRAGDFLVGSGRTVERVVLDGAFKRCPLDRRLRAPFPRGKVEVKVNGIVAYWNRSTRVAVR